MESITSRMSPHPPFVFSVSKTQLDIKSLNDGTSSCLLSPQRASLQWDEKETVLCSWAASYQQSPSSDGESTVCKVRVDQQTGDASKRSPPLKAIFTGTKLVNLANASEQHARFAKSTQTSLGDSSLCKGSLGCPRHTHSSIQQRAGCYTVQKAHVSGQDI